MIPPPVVRIPAPQAAPEPPRPGFPLVASLAPLAMAGVLFAVTGSPFMLLMAVLSPVVAAGTLLDGLRHRRRSRRDAAIRLVDDLAMTRDRVLAAQEAERRRLAGFAAGEPRWACTPEERFVVAVGRGEVPSGVEIAEPIDPRAEPEEVARLRAEAAALSGAPIVRDLAPGAAVQGPPVLAAAVARALLLRCAARVDPRAASISAPPGEDWARALPHAVAEGAERCFVVSVDEHRVRIGWDDDPVASGVLVDAAAGDAVTRAAARQAARMLAAAAEAAGLRATSAALPDVVAFADLRDARAGEGLRAPIGLDAAGEAVVLDLVMDGPHAVVAGTTGSGKSELLVTWVLGMAQGRTPDEVSFVLVDFKGGAAFAPVAGLPHVLGILSDLDERLARRAIESLRAEVLRRERLLAESGVRAIAELPAGALARLVVVVDEFAALVAERPELHALFADLSARGRSLGIHLVLCTQRPAGVVRDAVLANVAVRVALRVADRADSMGLLGDDAAARIPVGARGRAVLADGTGAVRAVQVALAAPDDVARLVAASPPGTTMRPWHDPLPAVIRHRDLPGAEGIPFGLLDLPAEQRQPPAALQPRHGHLLVLGSPGSGLTTALESVAAGAGDAARWLPADPVELWAALDPDRHDPGAVLLADDLDLALARCDPEWTADLVDRVARLLREAPHRDVRVVASARRLAGPVAGLAPQFGSRLLLRFAAREDHVLAGGDGGRHDPRATPGSGAWDGESVQVALPDPARRRAASGDAVPDVRAIPGDLAVVSGRPLEIVELLGSDDPRWVGVPDDRPRVRTGRTVLLGDPDAWQSDWSELTRARRELPIVFHACSPADVRAIARIRQPPPPLYPGELWIVHQGDVRRARWAHPA